jgi:hypothetical protein
VGCESEVLFFFLHCVFSSRVYLTVLVFLLRIRRFWVLLIPLNVEYEVTEFIPGMASFGFSVQHEFIPRG